VRPLGQGTSVDPEVSVESDAAVEPEAPRGRHRAG
jgi:hypothetical protein